MAIRDSNTLIYHEALVFLLLIYEDSIHVHQSQFSLFPRKLAFGFLTLRRFLHSSLHMFYMISNLWLIEISFYLGLEVAVVHSSRGAKPYNEMYKHESHTYVGIPNYTISMNIC